MNVPAIKAELAKEIKVCAVKVPFNVGDPVKEREPFEEVTVEHTKEPVPLS